MTRLHFWRTLAVLCLAAPLSVAMAAGPVSASGTTRWVDKDGRAGPTGCGGGAAAKKTIQAAVNVSGPNDTVKVCPGTYVQEVTISGNRHGLTLTSVTNHAAIIKAAADYTDNTIVLVKITNVDNVTVQGFSIEPLRDTSHESCDDGDGIHVSSSANVSITNNQIKPAGNGPFCGLFRGISITGGSTGTIHGNAVTDYEDGGIELGGSGTNVTVSSNTIIFAQVGIDPSPAGGPAVGLSSSATGAITGNTITGPASGPGNPPQPAAGVQLDGSGAGVKVSGNTISRMAADIQVTSGSGGSITGNTMSGGQTSVDLQHATNMTVSGNTAHAATVAGFYIANAASGVKVHDNDFTTSKNGNKLADCQGQSSQVVGAAKNNSFEDNKGDSSKPAAICAGKPPG